MYRVPIAIALTLAFAAIHADSVQILEPVNQHRLNFSLLQVGYDYLVKDSFYTGAHACITPIWDSNAHNIKTTDYFCSFEARIGRNFGISHKTSLIPYAAIGFNNYHRENVGMYLKKQTYVAFGLKYNHEFGPIFESGVGVKAISSFKNVYADTEFEKRDVNTKKLLQFNKVNSDKNYWGYEISIPLIWHFGETKQWDATLEPYYTMVACAEKLDLLGSKLTFGFRF